MKKWYPYSVYRNIVILFLKQRLFRRGISVRDERLVSTDYAKSWSESIADNVGGRKVRIQKVYDRLGVYRPIDYRKFSLWHIAHTIRSFQPKTILELGSGNGINLLSLAVLCPDVRSFVGVDLTPEGVETARRIFRDPPIPELVYLTEQPEHFIRESLARASIRFEQGNIRKLPFGDGSFDFSFSCWVFEQIPRAYLEGFREAHRVTSGQSLFLEEFKEAQENIFQLMHLMNVDYFHASFWEVEKVGYKVLKFEPIPVTKLKLSIGSLLCEARPKP